MPSENIKRFWEQTRSELAEVPLDASVEPVVPDGLLFEYLVKSVINYRVVMSSFGGKRIRAWFTVPAGEPPTGGWPAVMVVPGYGGVLALPLHLVQYGYATLALYPRSQGESEHEWELEYGTKLTYNLTDKNHYYYRGAYMDCLRGIDFLSGRSEIDKNRIGGWGGEVRAVD